MTARLDWDGGSAVMEPLGGMVAPLRLRLPDGRWVEPLSIAPWAGDALPPDTPGILRGLRGDFPCVPFGTGDAGPLAPRWADVPHVPEGPPHGAAANSEWQVMAAVDHLLARFEEPGDGPLAALEQTLRPDGPGRVALTLTIHPRRNCRLPLALHPIFRLSATPAGTRLDPTAPGPVWTHPTTAGEDPCPLAPDSVAADLAHLPDRDGSLRDYSHLPLPFAAESRLLIPRASGRFTLHHAPEGWSVTLDWDAAILPSVMLWVSNRGRIGAPWNARHIALGVEPCAAAFDLGTAASVGDTPLSRAGVVTAVPLVAGQPLVIRHAISVAA
jgi:hypothetical protein